MKHWIKRFSNRSPSQSCMSETAKNVSRLFLLCFISIALAPWVATKILWIDAHLCCIDNAGERKTSSGWRRVVIFSWWLFDSELWFLVGVASCVGRLRIRRHVYAKSECRWRSVNFTAGRWSSRLGHNRLPQPASSRYEVHQRRRKVRHSAE